MLNKAKALIYSNLNTSTKTSYFILIVALHVATPSFGSIVYYVEDFSLDSDISQPGYASSIFTHTENFTNSASGITSGPNYALQVEGTNNLDMIHRFDFDLPAGEVFIEAYVQALETPFGLGIRWIGSGGPEGNVFYAENKPAEQRYIYTAAGVQSATTVPVHVLKPDYLIPNFYPIGDIIAVEFYTPNAFYDNITIVAETNASVVPVPAAAWLFGSGLLGLIGVARRKKA